MPPKKGPAKGKSKSKGKDKGKDQKPGKMSKKEKKLYAKYGQVKVEDKDNKEVGVMQLRRDELEWHVEKLREHVMLNRSERIKFQLERDFLYDIMQTYWKKYRCLKIEEEKKIADTNRMNQDADDNKIIKGIEGKHFRYEAQLMCTAMDVRDEIRKKRLRDMLEKSWQYIAMDIEDHNDLLAKNAEKYRQKIADTREKLDDLNKYVEDHAKQLDEFTNNLIEQMEASMQLFHLIRRMEFQITEERWSEFIWKLSRNFELQYESMKNYYNDATHSNITLIFTLQDWMNDSIERMNMYQDQIEEYEKLMTDAHERMPALRSEYIQNRVKHDFIVRTKQGIRTTKKEIAISSATVNQYKGDSRTLLHLLSSVNTEREHLKANCEDIIGDVMQEYRDRYDIVKDETAAGEAAERYATEKKRLGSHFPSLESFIYSVRPYKSALDRKDEEIERLKLRRMRIQKQSEDLRSSLEARLLKVGLKKKHATEAPDQGLFTNRNRLDWGPANLVAKNSYPKPAVPVVKIRCPKLEDSEIKLCMTDSIRGFLAWRGQQRMSKKMATAANSEAFSIRGDP